MTSAVSEWFCDLLRMKLNSSKGKILSSSNSMHPNSPPLTIGGTTLKESVDLDILGVAFNAKTTIETHLRSVSRAASQRVGIMRESYRVFHSIQYSKICKFVLHT